MEHERDAFKVNRGMMLGAVKNSAEMPSEAGCRRRIRQYVL
jgi:hypothetical protein